jgi:hypothetical protein
MRFLLTLLAGVLCGALAAFGLVYYNPMSSAQSVTPLMVSDGRQVILGYSAVADEALLLTNNGEARAQPVPAKVAQLWEPTVRDTEVRVLELYDYRGDSVGVGIKFSSPSEQSDLLNGDYLVDAAWHLAVPRRGTLFVAQRENHWEYLRDIVVPAHWSTADSWRGSWRGLLSDGPNALGTARVFGGSGEYAGLELEAVEYLNASAYSATAGPVAADGELTIEFPPSGEQLASGTDGESD